MLSGFQTKLSSAGLIYKHYGKQIVSEMMGTPDGNPDVETVYNAAYKNFMEAIDAIDNGRWDYSFSGMETQYEFGKMFSIELSVHFHHCHGE